ncbi:hypothetical protein VP01_1878g4 [Puccinia sorghi]|uniref:Uncharacterized protein n=1 Tax=Puccinia sorghi TaxID=27349 RepID=A0A0L6VD59_9BASI|nr:hypothetical protein VP01_1878g4 [Puccinia sorghi]
MTGPPKSSSYNNSDVSPTFMIEPHPKLTIFFFFFFFSNQEANYEYLVELHKFAIGIIKEGVVASDVYHTIKQKVAAERADLAPYLPKSFRTCVYSSQIKSQFVTLPYIFAAVERKTVPVGN